MNRAAVKDLQTVGVAVYPNPTAGDIKVATTETFGGTTVLDIVIESEGSDQFEPQLDEFGQVWTYRVMHTE